MELSKVSRSATSQDLSSVIICGLDVIQPDLTFRAGLTGSLVFLCFGNVLFFFDFIVASFSTSSPSLLYAAGGVSDKSAHFPETLLRK